MADTSPTMEATHASRSASKRKATAAPPSDVAVVGLGYVGLPLLLAIEQAGFKARGFDIDTVKVEFLKRREASFLTGAEREQFAKSAARISSEESILSGADTFIICVPTPVKGNHRPDLSPLRDASMVVARHLRPGALVIVESTVNPGACEGVSLPLLEQLSGLSAGEDFSFAHCPERINPGDERYTVTNIPRVVGGLDGESLSRARALYQKVVDAEIIPMGSIREAEAVKMVENTFRDINIAFVNELAISFEKADLDVMNVLKGASTKPFGFMAHLPGCGVGGHCIPVDPYYLIHYGEKNGFQHRFLKTARAINNGMPRHTVRRLAQALRERGMRLDESVVALLGLSYKRDVGDMRESPAVKIRDELLQRGAVVKSFDPFTPGESTARSLEEALSGADAAVVATDHAAFRSLSPHRFLSSNVSVVVDGRNCLPKDRFIAEGILYRGIGR